MSLRRALLFLLLAVPVAAQSPQLIITQQNWALINQKQVLTLPQGENQVTVWGLPRQLEATSLMVTGLPGEVLIWRQTWDPGYSDQLKQAIGSEIEVWLPDRSIRGTLLELTPIDLLIQSTELNWVRVSSILGYTHSVKPNTQPKLSWWVENPTDQEEFPVELIYHTHGLSWSANYHVLLDAPRQVLRLSSLVQLLNNSGQDYQDAEITLLAGTIQQEMEYYPMLRTAADLYGMGSAPKRTATGSQHLYTLPRKVSLTDGESIEIPFFSTLELPYTEKWVFAANQGSGVRRVAEFTATEPLPQGRVLLMERFGNLVLPGGQTTLENTPAGEAISLPLGEVFDITAERTVLNVTQGRSSRDEEIQIRLVNRGEKPAQVYVQEQFWAQDWQVVRADREYMRRHAGLLEFLVDLDPGQEVVFTYTIAYKFQ